MERPQYSPEQESMELPKVHDFLHLSDQEIADLRGRLDKFDGTMRIFVHPAYRIYRDTEGRTDRQRAVDSKLSSDILTFLVKTLRTNKEECPPILVMDEHIEGENIDEQLKQLYEETTAESNNEIYTARTAENNPTPIFEEIPGGGDEKNYIDEHYDELWSRFLDILSGVGVKKVILAGSDFKIRSRAELDALTDEDLAGYKPFIRQRKKPDTKRLDYVPSDCAGHAAAILARRFKVELSHFTLPHSRHDQTRFEHGREDWDSYQKATEDAKGDEDGN